MISSLNFFFFLSFFSTSSFPPNSIQFNSRIKTCLGRYNLFQNNCRDYVLLCLNEFRRLGWPVPPGGYDQLRFAVANNVDPANPNPVGKYLKFVPQPLKNAFVGKRLNTIDKYESNVYHDDDYDD
jgi:hypothetical protein